MFALELIVVWCLVSIIMLAFSLDKLVVRVRKLERKIEEVHRGRE